MFLRKLIADRIAEVLHAEQYIEVHTTEHRGFWYNSSQFYRFDIGSNDESGSYGPHRLGPCDGIGSSLACVSVKGGM